MQLYFLTSVGWSRDSSGNLQAIDTAGNVVAKFLSGALSVKGNISQAASGTGKTVSATSFVSIGFGISFTPQVSTRAFVGAQVPQQSNTASTNVETRVYRNTTGVPANGVSVGTDTYTGVGNAFFDLTVNAIYTVSLVGIDTGLTLSTAYSYYLAAKVDIVATATFGVMTLTVEEL